MQWRACCVSGKVVGNMAATYVSRPLPSFFPAQDQRRPAPPGAWSRGDCRSCGWWAHAAAVRQRETVCRRAVSACLPSTTTWQSKLITKAATQGWPFSIVVLCSLRVREVPGSIPGRAQFFYLIPCQQRSQWSAGPWRQCRICGCVQDGTSGTWEGCEQQGERETQFPLCFRCAVINHWQCVFLHMFVPGGAWVGGREHRQHLCGRESLPRHHQEGVDIGSVLTA
jgi:hypothetical protein